MPRSRLLSLFTSVAIVAACSSDSEDSAPAVTDPTPDAGPVTSGPPTSDGGSGPPTTSSPDASGPAFCDPLVEGFDCQSEECEPGSTACVPGADSTLWSAWTCPSGRWEPESCVAACGDPQPVSGAIMEYGACVSGSCQCGTRTVCGNGFVEDRVPIGTPEECEPGNEMPCADFTGGNYVEGTLVCADNCMWDTRDCRSVCGDGIVGTGEQCEPGTTWEAGCGALGFLQDAPIPCTSECFWDQSVCQGARCGDFTVEAGEVCDRDKIACGDIGLGIGLARCKADCQSWDVTSCTECGNGVVEGGETCETGETWPCQALGWEFGTATCSSDCLRWETSGCSGAFCGDGTVGGTEVCDRNSITCTTGQGTAPCRTDCRGWKMGFCATSTCGDGVVEGAERCDDDSIPCIYLGYPDPVTSGMARCLADCSGYDESTCGTCGDGIKNGNESCDGDALQCGDGTPAPCFDNCNGYGTSVCLPPARQSTCGNGIREAGEGCDGDSLDCASSGLGTGTAPCSAGCTTHDESQCSGGGSSSGTDPCTNLKVCVEVEVQTSQVVCYPQTDGVRIYLQNKCGRDITISVSGEKSNGQWATENGSPVAPGDTHTWWTCSGTGSYDFVAIPYTTTGSVKDCFPNWPPG